MSNTVIIYSETNTNKDIAVVWPVDYKFTLHEVARRSVPKGHKYKILNDFDLPTTDMYQSIWEYDFTNSYDGVGGISDIEWNTIVNLKNKK